MEMRSNQHNHTHTFVILSLRRPKKSSTTDREHPHRQPPVPQMECRGTDSAMRPASQQWNAGGPTLPHGAHPPRTILTPLRTGFFFAIGAHPPRTIVTPLRTGSPPTALTSCCAIRTNGTICELREGRFSSRRVL